MLQISLYLFEHYQFICIDTNSGDIPKCSGDPDNGKVGILVLDMIMFNVVYFVISNTMYIISNAVIIFIIMFKIQ